MAKVVAVNISQHKGTFKYPVPLGHATVDHGLAGDAHAGNWHRQISLLAQESIEVHTLPVGTRLRIGECLAEVTQIGKECHQHCQIYKQVGMCIMPTEGIFVKVLEDGDIRPGDPITVEAEA